MKRFGALGIVALVAALGGACQFDTSFEFAVRVDPGRPGDQFRDACHDQARARCSYQARCKPFLFELAWTDAATCEDRETLECQLEATDPSSTYDDASIRSCTWPADMPCPSEAGYDSALAAFRATCERPPGKLSEGAACVYNSACASGFCLQYPSQSFEVCGACAPPPCGGSCAAGEICVLKETSTCVAQGAVGEACSEPLDCATFHCDGGVCSEPLSIGDACDPTAPACAALDAYCDPTTSVCHLLAVAQANEPCGWLPSGLTVCGGGAACSYTSEATCIPPAEDGAFCDPSQNLNCLSPAMCIEGYCRFHRPACTPTT